MSHNKINKLTVNMIWKIAHFIYPLVEIKAARNIVQNSSNVSFSRDDYRLAVVRERIYAFDSFGSHKKWEGAPPVLLVFRVAITSLDMRDISKLNSHPFLEKSGSRV